MNCYIKRVHTIHTNSYCALNRTLKLDNSYMTLATLSVITFNGWKGCLSKFSGPVQHSSTVNGKCHVPTDVVAAPVDTS